MFIGSWVVAIMVRPPTYGALDVDRFVLFLLSCFLGLTAGLAVLWVTSGRVARLVYGPDAARRTQIALAVGLMLLPVGAIVVEWVLQRRTRRGEP